MCYLYHLFFPEEDVSSLFLNDGTSSSWVYKKKRTSGERARGEWGEIIIIRLIK